MHGHIFLHGGTGSCIKGWRKCGLDSVMDSAFQQAALIQQATTAALYQIGSPVFVDVDWDETAEPATAAHDFDPTMSVDAVASAPLALNPSDMPPGGFMDMPLNWEPTSGVWEATEAAQQAAEAALQGV
jgi:hypothetical protein